MVFIRDRSRFLHYLADDQNDTCIPYDKIMPIIKKSGYDGYLIAEYEGHHFNTSIRAEVQLRRYVAMSDKILGRA